VEQRNPAICNFFNNMESKGGMIKPTISLQGLRRRIYVKAKAEPAWRFWGLYVHVCKIETLQTAYTMAKLNDGAPGIDGVTFKAIEYAGVKEFLQQIHEELVSRTYRPTRNRKKEIPKNNGKFRVLGIPTIRDRVVQGALKLILEPIFEADFQPGSYGYRPKRTAHEALSRVDKAILYKQTQVIDVDLRAYFDNVRHHILLEKVAKRVEDKDVMRLLKQILKASGKKGVPQGGVISPLLSNIYLNEVDKMLERAKIVTQDKYTHLEYARFADDIVVLIDGYPRHEWLVKAVNKRLREEFTKLQVEVNEEKTRQIDLTRDEAFGFLGFEIRRVKSRTGGWRPQCTPMLKKRTDLLQKLKEKFWRLRSRPIAKVIEVVTPILRGWINYFAWGHSSRCFTFIRDWVEKKVRRHLMCTRKRKGFGWKRWSRQWLYEELGLFSDYHVRRSQPMTKALPAR
jgi:RNA-directed DNA polymerase